MDFLSIWNNITIEQLGITVSLAWNVYNVREIKECKRLYNQVDKLTFGIAIAIQRIKGIKLIKQSADGVGDNALNRDV